MFKLLTACMRKFTIAALGGMVAIALAAPAAAAPQNPNRGDFCPGSLDVTTQAVYLNNPATGVTISSVIDIPSSGGTFGIYIRNNGTNDLTIPPGPFSTALGQPIPQATNTPVPTIPLGGGAVFNDNYFSFFNPPLGPSQDVVGCVSLSPGSGTVPLFLTYKLGSKTYSWLILVQYQK